MPMGRSPGMMGLGGGIGGGRMMGGGTTEILSPPTAVRPFTGTRPNPPTVSDVTQRPNPDPPGGWRRLGTLEDDLDAPLSQAQVKPIVPHDPLSRDRDEDRGKRQEEKSNRGDEEKKEQVEEEERKKKEEQIKKKQERLAADQAQAEIQAFYAMMERQKMEPSKVASTTPPLLGGEYVCVDEDFAFAEDDNEPEDD